jgi:hypothetical protein
LSNTGDRNHLAWVVDKNNHKAYFQIGNRVADTSTTEESTKGILRICGDTGHIVDILLPDGNTGNRNVFLPIWSTNMRLLVGKFFNSTVSYNGTASYGGAMNVNLGSTADYFPSGGVFHTFPVFYQIRTNNTRTIGAYSPVATAHSSGTSAQALIPWSVGTAGSATSAWVATAYIFVPNLLG